jgi:hypothetical protein
MKLYVLLECTKYGNSLYCYDAQEKRDFRLKEILSDYSNEYNKNIENYQDLCDITFNEVWIDLYEINLNE